MRCQESKLLETENPQRVFFSFLILNDSIKKRLYSKWKQQRKYGLDEFNLYSTLSHGEHLPNLQVHTFVQNTEDENVKHEQGTEDLCQVMWLHHQCNKNWSRQTNMHGTWCDRQLKLTEYKWLFCSVRHITTVMCALPGEHRIQVTGGIIYRDQGFMQWLASWQMVWQLKAPN